VHVLHTNKAVVSSSLATEIVASAGWPASAKDAISGERGANEAWWFACQGL